MSSYLLTCLPAAPCPTARRNPSAFPTSPSTCAPISWLQEGPSFALISPVSIPRVSLGALFRTAGRIGPGPDPVPLSRSLLSQNGQSSSTEQTGLGICSVGFCFVTCPFCLGRSPDTEPLEARLFQLPVRTNVRDEVPVFLGKLCFFWLLSMLCVRDETRLDLVAA